MAYDKQKLLRFKESVLADADEKIAKIKQDALNYEQTELENLRQQNYDKIFTYMQDKVRNLKWKYSRKVTKKSLELKKETLAFRNELVNKIFKKCEEEILNFSRSNKYKPYLLEQVKKASSDFNCKDAKIKVRKEDLKYEKELLDQSGASKIEIDEENQLGGFKLINENFGIMLDKTIANSLYNERQYFHQEFILTLNND